MDLSYNALARRHQSLVSAANYHFGSFRQAVLMAGLDYSRIRRKPKWTEEKVIGIIKRARRAGEDLSWRAVTARGDELAHAAMAAVHPQLFGHWNDALLAAGINPQRVSRYRRWNKTSIIDELKLRASKNWPVNAGHIQVELPGLYGAATRLFGSYNKALIEAGIKPEVVRQRRDWSRRKVLSMLEAFQQTHGTLSHTAIRDRDPGLLRAVYKYFPGIKAARARIARQEPTLWSQKPRRRRGDESASSARPGTARRQQWKSNGAEQLSLFDAPPPRSARRRRIGAGA